MLPSVTEALQAPDAMPTRALLGSNLDGVRQHNLGTVLRLVHGMQQCELGTVLGLVTWMQGRSRTDLPLAFGLSPATVGALVGELAALGVVAETEPRESTGVGRPIAVVPAMPIVFAVTVTTEI